MRWVGPATQAPGGLVSVLAPYSPLPSHSFSLPTLPHSAHIPCLCLWWISVISSSLSLLISVSPSITVSVPPSLSLCPCVCPPAPGPFVFRWGEPSTQPQPLWWRTSSPIRSTRSGWRLARRRAWAPSPRLCASAHCRPVRVSRRLFLGGGGCSGH